METLYARKHYIGTIRYEVQLFKDKECTERVARFPSHLSNKPTKRNSWTVVNCAKVALEWLPDTKEPVKKT